MWKGKKKNGIKKFANKTTLPWSISILSILILTVSPLLKCLSFFLSLILKLIIYPACYESKLTNAASSSSGTFKSSSLSES